MTIEFITTREFENNGKARIIKLKEEADAMVEYICPSCGFKEKKREAWAEPLVTGMGVKKKFLVKCSKCSFEIKFLKLKKEIKKKK